MAQCILTICIQMTRKWVLLQTVCFVWFDSLCPSQQFFSYVGTGLPGLNQYQARINVSCSRTQHRDASEARTWGPSVSSQVLYNWATVLPLLANSENPDNNAAFHQGLHFLATTKVIFRETKYYLKIIACDSSIYMMDHPKFIEHHSVWLAWFLTTKAL